MKNDCSDRFWALVLVATLAAAAGLASSTNAASVSLVPATMPCVASVDDRYQSYNVEMAEVIGAKFWKPYKSQREAAPKAKTAATASKSSGAAALQIGQDPAMFEARPPVDLSNARLRKLAAALGPAYVRVSGTWANSVYFKDSDDAALTTPPQGFQGILTRREWAGVIDFSKAVNAKLVTSFSISQGVRDSAGVWTPDQARRFFAYTKSVGGEIVAAEFFNEPSFAAMGGAPPGYDAASYARDFSVFQAFAKATDPEMLMVGPGSVGEGVKLMPGPLLKTADIFAATPRPVFDVFSYHSYAAASERCASLGGEIAGTTDGAALSEEWLARPDEIDAFYQVLGDRFEPGKPVWVTETADAACGGNPWASTFLDTFRYLDQHGRMAKRGIKVVFHNTLASSEYGLIDQHTLTPRPNYWAALLWRKLMGRTVLNAGPSHPGLHVYAHCLPDHPGGVTLLAINTNRIKVESIDLPMSANRYTLTAQKLKDSRVQLNGHELRLDDDGELPRLDGRRIFLDHVEFAPASITFLAFAEAGNKSCQ
jgi:heparanase